MFGQDRCAGVGQQDGIQASQEWEPEVRVGHGTPCTQQPRQLRAPRHGAGAAAAFSSGHQRRWLCSSMEVRLLAWESALSCRGRTGCFRCIVPLARMSVAVVSNIVSGGHDVASPMHTRMQVPLRSCWCSLLRPLHAVDSDLKASKVIQALVSVRVTQT